MSDIEMGTLLSMIVILMVLFYQLYKFHKREFQLNYKNMLFFILVEVSITAIVIICDNIENGTGN